MNYNLLILELEENSQRLSSLKDYLKANPKINSSFITVEQATQVFENAVILFNTVSHLAPTQNQESNPFLKDIRVMVAKWKQIVDREKVSNRALQHILDQNIKTLLDIRKLVMKIKQNAAANQADIKDLREEHKYFKERSTLLETKQLSLEEKIATLSDSKNSLDEDLTLVVQVNQELEQKLAELNSQLENKADKTELEKTSRRLEKAKQNLIKSRKKVADLTVEGKSVEEKRKELEGNISALQQAFLELNEAHHELGIERDLYKEDSENARSELSSLKEKHKHSKVPSIDHKDIRYARFMYKQIQQYEDGNQPSLYQILNYPKAIWAYTGHVRIKYFKALSRMLRTLGIEADKRSRLVAEMRQIQGLTRELEHQTHYARGMISSDGLYKKKKQQKNKDDKTKLDEVKPNENLIIVKAIENCKTTLDALLPKLEEHIGHCKEIEQILKNN